MATPKAPEKRAAVHIAYPSTDPATGEKTKFDMDYYLSHHIPLLEKLWGKYNLLSWSITQYPSPDPVTGQPAPYLVQTTALWETLDDFKAALADESSKLTAADVVNYTSVRPVMWTGEVIATS